MTDTEERKLPPIVLVGVGGGGSRILSEGLEKLQKHSNLDRYSCLLQAIRADEQEPHVFIVDTSSDPNTEGFYQNIPKNHKISLSSSIKGMSRGAGGKPGRAVKAVLNEEVSRTLAEQLYKPINDISPAIVVFMHTADGGTGGGLTPELIQQLAYVLPQSTVFWVFTVMPTISSLSLQGPRTVGPNLGKMLKVIRRIAEKDFNEIPFECREAIRSTVPQKRQDRSYEFQHSRVALFPMSNDHFAQCSKGYGKMEIREEVLNPFPMELLSQALYPFLKYVVATPEEQQWMQKYWPMGPIDIPDIMAGVQADRPIVTPHLWIDPEGWGQGGPEKVIQELKESIIHLERIEGDVEEGLPDSFTFTGAPSGLFEFRATSMYCIPVYPDGSKYFDEFGEYISDEWFPKLSGSMKFVGGSEGKKIGVISHSANLKPQPITRPNNGNTLGFDNGLLVTLIFGAIPEDFPIWLKATKDIMREHKTEDMWELSFYDANDWLNELGRYIGWRDWLTQDYKPPKDL